MARKTWLPANVLKTPLPGQRLNVDITKLHLLLCMLQVMTLIFVTVPECLYVKPQRCALTAHELPYYMDLCG